MTGIASSEPACRSSSTYLDLCFHLAYDRSRAAMSSGPHVCLSLFLVFYQYSPLSPSNLSFCLPAVSVSPLLPLFPCFSPALHTCSGDPALCLPAWAGPRTDGPVFYDNHHIACMPAPLLSLFLSPLICDPSASLPRPGLQQPRHPSLSASAPSYISPLTGSLSIHNASVSFFSPFSVGFINRSRQLQCRHLG